MTAQTLRVAPVRTPASGLRHQTRAAIVVWQRELIRFGRDRARMVASFVQPVLFLFVLGTGLSSLVQTGSEDVDFRTFLFPGVLAMSVLFTAIFSGISMVWDREFGFLREMAVAPVSSAAILVGKCLGGATVATMQSLVILLLAGVVGVPYDPVMMLELAGLLFLMAFMVTALGLLLAARIKQIQTAMPVVQLIIMPMMFLSGALFPLAGLPTWLAVVTRLNPLTYAVEPMRSVVFDHLSLSPASRAALDPGVTWGGWHVPVLLQVALVVVLGVGLLALAVLRFARTE
ncbi:MAG: ABC transporter permease [Actinomycetes bacterium]